MFIVSVKHRIPTYPLVYFLQGQVLQQPMPSKSDFPHITYCVYLPSVIVKPGSLTFADSLQDFNYFFGFQTVTGLNIRLVLMYLSFTTLLKPFKIITVL